MSRFLNQTALVLFLIAFSLGSCKKEEPTPSSSSSSTPVPEFVCKHGSKASVSYPLTSIVKTLRFEEQPDQAFFILASLNAGSTPFSAVTLLVNQKEESLLPFSGTKVNTIGSSAGDDGLGIAYEAPEQYFAESGSITIDDIEKVAGSYYISGTFTSLDSLGQSIDGWFTNILID